MNTLMRIQQGDQFAIPFPIFLGDVRTEPANVVGVRIQINNALCEYPGELTYDYELGAWQFPLTEEQTRSWAVDMLPAQVGVKVENDDFRYCPTFKISLEKNIITDVWGGDGT